ncbi:MAG: hypothetical protein JSV99_02880 [Planctomycetota bacterium]|nr:MAG: hypothetical protein JSV99_02880 [Planctomycetota bacterium]
MEDRVKGKSIFGRVVVFGLVLVCLAASGPARADYSELAKLTASDGSRHDYFGASVSVSGDYAIIGAYGYGGYSGSAYIFKREGEVWIEQANLTASDGAYSDYFGGSVSISGDYAIVGAGLDDDNGNWSGSAYIFKREGQVWSQQGKLTASDGAESDLFGCAVSISEDYAIVGAYGDNDNGNNSGSAYIFKRDGTVWSEQDKLTASDDAADDWFGWSVSISGDYAIVGVCRDDDNGYDSGSSYIFKRDGMFWSEQDKLTASDGNEIDWFGTCVSISGDYAIIGANYDDDNGSSSGSAYIFKREGEVWIEQDKLTASDGTADDRFGGSVSISGDYVIIGAQRDGDNGYHSGSAYIFKRDGKTWSEEAKLTASDGYDRDYFGGSVCVVGSDYAVVGAYYGDGNWTDSGAAYLFDVAVLSASIEMDEMWMYQSLPGQSNSALTAGVSVTDDPMGNTTYSYAWEILLPGDVNLAPVTVTGGGASDAYWTFAARGCDEPGGLSDSGQTFTVRVTVTGDDYGNTGQAEAEFGIALLGDTNNDGVVNVADRSITNAFWRTGSAGAYTLRDCDVNCDGVVNVADRSIANAIWRGILGQNSVGTPCPLR